MSERNLIFYIIITFHKIKQIDNKASIYSSNTYSICLIIANGKFAYILLSLALSVNANKINGKNN